MTQLLAKLASLHCWICGAHAALHYIYYGDGKFDTRPRKIGSTDRVKTKVCKPCGTTVIEDRSWERIESSS